MEGRAVNHVMRVCKVGKVGSIHPIASGLQMEPEYPPTSRRLNHPKCYGIKPYVRVEPDVLLERWL